MRYKSYYNTLISLATWGRDMAASASAETGLRFDPPGPGSWMRELTHFTRPVTRFVAEIFPEPFRRAYQEGTKRFGTLLDYHEWQFVNGWSYLCPRMVAAPKDAVTHPPKHVWDHLMQSDPAIRERLNTSASVFERKVWREDLRHWDQEVKPASISRHRAIQAVDPSSLSTDALLAHLGRCRENLAQGYYLHHRYNLPAVVPIGDFLAQAADWTRSSPTELLSLLQGWSPISLGAADELRLVAQAIGRDRAASMLLFSPNPPGEVLTALQALPGEVGVAILAYIDLVGFRPVNDQDVSSPYVLEMPELLVRTMRSAVERMDISTGDDAVALHTETIRSAVPETHRRAFDELLAEARTISRLRDERAVYGDLWACGLARRAILVGGRQLAKSGRIAHPSHLVEANYEEMQLLIARGEGPSAQELADRARYRLDANAADAPPFLGPPPGTPLPFEWLPPAAARLERALETAFKALFLASSAPSEARKVRGLAASAGRYEGTARLVHGATDFGRIEQGDILVTTATTAAFNVVLPLLGAIVTERGGPLSHAAIVAREYGIPAIVGCADATRRIPDGARVRVDGSAGEAVVLD